MTWYDMLIWIVDILVALLLKYFCDTAFTTSVLETSTSPMATPNTPSLSPDAVNPNDVDFTLRSTSGDYQIPWNYSAEIGIIIHLPPLPPLPHLPILVHKPTVLRHLPPRVYPPGQLHLLDAPDMDLQGTTTTPCQWRPYTLPNHSLPIQSRGQLGCGRATCVPCTFTTHTILQSWLLWYEQPEDSGCRPLCTISSPWALRVLPAQPFITEEQGTMIQRRHPITTYLWTRFLRSPYHSQDTTQSQIHYTQKAPINHTSPQGTSQQTSDSCPWWATTLEPQIQHQRNDLTHPTETRSTSQQPPTTTTLHPTDRLLGTTSLRWPWSLGRTTREGQRRPRVPSSYAHIRQAHA